LLIGLVRLLTGLLAVLLAFSRLLSVLLAG
jgi:hypothetical protein